MPRAAGSAADVDEAFALASSPFVRAESRDALAAIQPVEDYSEVPREATSMDISYLVLRLP